MNVRRLKKLLKIGETILRKNLPMGFNAEGFDCGSYACWGGYYCRQTRGGQKMRNLDVLAAHFDIPFQDVTQVLGVSWATDAPDEAGHPGPAARAELAKRINTLRSMLAPQKEPSR